MLCSADFSTVLAVGRPRWTLKAKLRVRSEYGGSACGLILLKNAPMLSHVAFSFAGSIMSGFCIFRAEKHNTVGAVSAALSHDLRARQTPNADPKLYNKNTYSSSDIDAVLTEMKRLVDSCDEKCKNDKPVLCIQYLVTASPEAADDPAFSFDKYLNDGLEALKQKHGAENVIFSAIHRDETTPHMTVYVVPIVDEPTKKVKRSVYTGKKDKDGKAIREVREVDSKAKRKLSAANFMDGSAKLSAMQTWFHEAVGAKYGLQRGVLGSKARHKTIASMYAEINKKAEIKLKLPDLDNQIVSEEKSFFGTKEIYETDKERNSRVASELNKQLEPLLIKSNGVEFYKDKNKKLNKTNKQLSNDNEKLRKIITAQDKGISVSDTRSKELTILANCADLAEQHERLKAETESKKIEIQNSESTLLLLSKKIEDASRAASNIAQSFSNRCVSLIHAVFQRDVREVADNINDLSECIKEILTDAPELEDILIKETEPLDKKMEQPLFESIIKQSRPVMRK